MFHRNISAFCFYFFDIPYSMVQRFKPSVARWWKALGNNSAQCFLCPRHCLVEEGARGFCFVRQNISGKLCSSSYGLTSGFAVDPIEKKPLYHFYPGTKVLSFGTIGCNLGCKFCQNWHISKPDVPERLCEEESPADVAQGAKKSKCAAVAFTYNEPIISAEYVIDTAKECHACGIKTVAVSDGYIGEEAREEFFLHMDAANIDLKGFTEAFYQKLCSARLQPVLDTLIFIKKKTKTWLEITNLIIPGENDAFSEIRVMCAWIVKNLGKDVPLHFSAFHPSFQMMDRLATPRKMIIEARKIAIASGLKYVYSGNIDDAAGSSTYCKNCKKVIVHRDGYAVTEFNLKNGKCSFCQTTCEGFFV